MSLRNNCMFLLPRELTGLGSLCGLLKTCCNGYGRRCVVYQPHTAESRKALAEAIAKRKEEMLKKEARDADHTRGSRHAAGQKRDFPRTPRGRENNKPNNKEQQ